MNETSYVYKWIHIPTMRWYIGSRTKKGCHPDDGYICSSKIVKPLILESPSEWRREIIAIGNSSDMIKLENKILIELDAKNNLSSFNMHNGDGLFTTARINLSNEWKDKISKSNKGKIRTDESKEKYKKANKLKIQDPSYIAKLKKPKPESHKKNVSLALLGKTKTSSHREALSKSQKIKADMLRTGKTYNEIFGDKAEEIKQKMSLSQKGKPCNNPIVTCPHCNKKGPSGAMNRWHFDNCKKI